MAVILPVDRHPVDHQQGASAPASRRSPSSRTASHHPCEAAVALGGLASMLLAFGIGALGNLLGAASPGRPTVWDITGGDFAGLTCSRSSTC